MTDFDSWKTREPEPDAQDEEAERCPGCGANQSADEDCDDDCPEHLEREADAGRETNLEVADDYRSSRRGR